MNLVLKNKDNLEAIHYFVLSLVEIGFWFWGKKTKCEKLSKTPTVAGEALNEWIIMSF